ncbi:DUF4391 domain-containing protein [Marinobacter psychrophilus]|jgi:hypothetical protein|uniref:DUF4391 domain-containing protein n=1 Tax=Marinobacter psychrophilus TaxID=330734 RepID=UPI001B6A96B6|nr:DUF4391 domain-containing protein [Marinobacter psychrophilus]MBQ0762091.1 DUF4391 domain-containing protein [Marinobacter psychrophilus]MBQ0843665.1 DUF4391 domain-containing protein [Marinobacter psychrophilus]
MTLFAWPKKAAFERVVPKSKIYEYGAVGGALKERFVQQVEQITWAYKLAPETLNLPATKTVTEIQVFRVALKGAELDRGVLKAIDRAIPFPLIFELIQGTRIKVAAAYKQSSRSQKGEDDSSRWRIGNYFETCWLPEHTTRQPLPVALDMSSLYEQLLGPLVQNGITRVKEQSSVAEARESPAAIYSVTATSEQPARVTLEQRIELAEAMAAQLKEIEQVKARLGREKQFNKRVAINAELRGAKQKLITLEEERDQNGR